VSDKKSQYDEAWEKLNDLDRYALLVYLISGLERDIEKLEQELEVLRWKRETVRAEREELRIKLDMDGER
jgi:hypothetical protein